MGRELADLAVALYAASCACYVWLLYAPRNWLGRAATLLLSGGIVSEYFALLERSHGIHAVPYGDLYGSMSLFAWLLAVTYLGLEMLHRQRSVGAFVTLLLTVWTVGTLLAVPQGEPAVSSARGALFALHVTLDTWAYAAFALSFVLSLIYLVQNWVLRTRKPTATFWRFPALDVLDGMARSSVSIGLLTLVCGVIMGLIWRHRLSGTYSWGDPKVIVTLAIFAVYIAYLGLARSAGWRGARAAIICASNFLVVLFSYTFVNLYFTDFHRFY
jgi:ABC-type transport system involved in cytochrome c biogenesis permease subunit